MLFSISLWLWRLNVSAASLSVPLSTHRRSFLTQKKTGNRISHAMISLFLVRMYFCFVKKHFATSIGGALQRPTLFSAVSTALTAARQRQKGSCLVFNLRYLSLSPHTRNIHPSCSKCIIYDPLLLSGKRFTFVCKCSLPRLSRKAFVWNEMEKNSARENWNWLEQAKTLEKDAGVSGRRSRLDVKTACEHTDGRWVRESERERYPIPLCGMRRQYFGVCVSFKWKFS